MFKTKLLILLLISFSFFSCTKDSHNENKFKYSVEYIGGEYDGLFLKNLLTNKLSNFGLYDEDSIFNIVAGISHSPTLFITNIDNTSDRMRLDSVLTVEVVDKRFKCITYKYQKKLSQFYIFAGSDRYISNNSAEKKIKEENSEALVKNFINKLEKPNAICKNLSE